jgi:MOSC domain-containing protein
MPLHIAALWRYPVKSMAGEPLEMASISSDGIAGDRLVHVRGPEGVRTARRHYRLLGLRGTLSPEGHVLVNGLPWESPQALALVKAAAGDDAWLADYDGPERFDILPLLVATDGAVASFGRDVRRLRPNILIGGVDGLAERSWPGRGLRMPGDAEAGPIIRLVSLRGRCAMTIVDPDTLVRDHDVLRDIGRRFDGKLALDSEVIRPGEIRVGAEVEVYDPR